jgi:conjugative relaxase-like TrwC/TraI family protein
MLRITPNRSVARAQSYYSTADYYTEGQELEGSWGGRGAARLGLDGKVTKEAWDALCDNRDPATNQTLTARRKSERRVGYDFNFHCPKSVSLLYGMTRDERIMTAFRDSVRETMRDMESEMKTRVRVGGRNEDRATGNMAWGEFIHLTARPVEGIPDPHLHAHCFVFNTTFDDKEQRWKAGQFADLKRDAPYFEAVFHSRLAMRLREDGLPIQRTRTGWEIAGIPTSALEKFSRRKALIEEEARTKGVTDPKEKAELGARTRERKQKDLSLDQLQTLWQERLSDDESDLLGKAGRRLGTAGTGQDAKAAGHAVDLAIEHCFERKSVVPERQLQAAAIMGAVGNASAAAVEEELRRRELLSAERQGRRMVTTSAVLAEEERTVDFARRGRGSCAALGGGAHEFTRSWLNADQRKAVHHVLESHDRVILIRGAAGVGKTSMMQEAVEAIEAEGTKVRTFAPSADASRGVLRTEGFEDAETVARLLADPNLQQEVQGQVIWIDEAGLLGARAMAQVFELADKLDARVILSGDRRQHGAVERGAPLRLLETEAGLVPAEIKNIMRQKGQYMEAVRALSEERTAEGFQRLSDLGWIKEVPDEERYKVLAKDYVETIMHGQTALVVSPTHREGQRITDEIRGELKTLGKLGEAQQTVRVLENTNLTVAQRRDAVNYMEGDVVVFHQNAKGHRRGERMIVGDNLPPLAQAERFQVFHASTLALAPGDLIRITHNGRTADKQHDLRNGARYTVEGFKANGDIRLTNGWTIARDFGHLAYGHVVTSHSSQGKTVDRVFIGQSSDSFPASSREQFYVSVSRARARATVYTDDRSALLQAVEHSDDRLSAMEMMGPRTTRRRQAAMLALEEQREHVPVHGRNEQVRGSHE